MLGSCSKSLLECNEHTIFDGLVNHLDLSLSSVFVSIVVDLGYLIVTSFLFLETL